MRFIKHTLIRNLALLYPFYITHPYDTPLFMNKVLILFLWCGLHLLAFFEAFCTCCITLVKHLGVTLGSVCNVFYFFACFIGMSLGFRLSTTSCMERVWELILYGTYYRHVHSHMCTKWTCRCKLLQAIEAYNKRASCTLLVPGMYLIDFMCFNYYTQSSCGANSVFRYAVHVSILLAWLAWDRVPELWDPWDLRESFLCSIFPAWAITLLQQQL